MTDNFNRAMDKLRDEMATSKGRYVQVVGDYLTDYLQANPDSAGKILGDKLTIAGSLKAMEAEAKTHREGNVGILDDHTAFGIVLGYFGIEGKGSPTTADAVPLPAAAGRQGDPQTPAEMLPHRSGEVPAQAGDRAPIPDPFDLDALMGGLA